MWDESFLCILMHLNEEYFCPHRLSDPVAIKPRRPLVEGDQTKRIGVFGDFYQARKAIWLILQRGGYFSKVQRSNEKNCSATLLYVTLRYKTTLFL